MHNYLLAVTPESATVIAAASEGASDTLVMIIGGIVFGAAIIYRRMRIHRIGF